jgi:hypothetical protein
MLSYMRSVRVKNRYAGVGYSRYKFLEGRVQ